MNGDGFGGSEEDYVVRVKLIDRERDLMSGERYVFDCEDMALRDGELPFMEPNDPVPFRGGYPF